MALYSEKVMDHFTNPRNVGVIEDADGVGEVGNARCGDIMKIYLKISNGIIEDVKFKTFGCGSVVVDGDRNDKGQAALRGVGADQQGGCGGAGRFARA